MTHEFSCGVIPVHIHGREHRYLLVQHRSGHWGFPKGHVEDGENVMTTARRELGEEVGIHDAHIMPEPAYRDQYVFRFRGKTIKKDVTLLLGRVTHRRIRPQPGEIIDAHWFDYRTARAVLGKLSSGAILERAHQYLQQHPRLWASGQADRRRQRRPRPVRRTELRSRP